LKSQDNWPGAGGTLAGKRVLVVEDETLVAMLLEDMIADLGAVLVGSASRVTRALEIINGGQSEIDLAVLDVNLGGEDAFPIAAALAKRGIPFAFSTGYGSAGLPDEWRNRPTLQKPFTHDQVKAVLTRALAESSTAPA
jgi:CheY-like chemotaxis protein